MSSNDAEPGFYPKAATHSGSYNTSTPWGPFGAIGICVAVLIFQVILAIIILAGWIVSAYGIDIIGEVEQFLGEETGDVVNMFFISFEVLGVLLIMLAAGLRGGSISRVLALTRPKNFIREAIIAIILIGVFGLIYEYGQRHFFPSSAAADMQGMIKILTIVMQSDLWWLGLLAMVIGAPLSEEMMFRGFLLSAFSKTRIGYWGAAIIVSAMWALLHAGYSIVALSAIFTLGMIMALVLKRTGSLWMTIAIHIVWNSIAAYGIVHLIGTRAV